MQASPGGDSNSRGVWSYQPVVMMNPLVLTKMSSSNDSTAMASDCLRVTAATATHSVDPNSSHATNTPQKASTRALVTNPTCVPRREGGVGWSGGCDWPAVRPDARVLRAHACASEPAGSLFQASHNKQARAYPTSAAAPSQPRHMRIFEAAWLPITRK